MNQKTQIIFYDQGRWNDGYMSGPIPGDMVQVTVTSMTGSIRVVQGRNIRLVGQA